MAQIRKISQQTEIMCSGDIHFQQLKDKPHELSKICPSIIESCKLVEGEWGTVGSVIKWSYHHNGKSVPCTEIITAIDNQERSIRFKVIEGDMMMLYNSFELTLKINKNGTKESVSWTIEYERMSEVEANPNEIMDLIMAMTKDIEIYHLN